MSDRPIANPTTRRLDTREIRTILVPTDFSDAANYAFIYAANLAWSLQAKLVGLHVYYQTPVPAGAPLEFVESLQKEKVKEAESRFNDYRFDLMKTLGDEVEATFLVEPGYAPDQILKTAETIDADLIVMGTLGQESMSEKILGSVTTRVIEKGGCPVLAIPKGAQYQPIRHILYATNFEDTDTMMIDQLLNYCDAFDATLTCLHVHTPAESDQELELTSLENLYSAEIDSRKLRFQMVNNADIVRGIHHYVVTHQVDMVTFLTHRRNYEIDAWQKGLTRAFSLETDVPLLAFHEDAQ